MTVDVSRCLCMRFSGSSCRHCADICPHGAVTLDRGLSINPDQCHGCMLCTSACPSGALEPKGDFTACVAELSRVPEALLGCTRTKNNSNATLACLGGLAEEHLLTLCHTLPGTLQLNLTACGECSNSVIIPHLRQRLEALSVAGLMGGGCTIVMAESAQDINYHDELVDRRSFFKSFRKSLFKSAAVMLSSSDDQTGQRTEYAAKRVSGKRKLLNKLRATFPQELLNRLEMHFETKVSFRGACTKCQGCVAICPTGALHTEQSDCLPTHTMSVCSGCGLCGEFCIDGALLLTRGCVYKA